MDYKALQKKVEATKAREDIAEKYNNVWRLEMVGNEYILTMYSNVLQRWEGITRNAYMLKTWKTKKGAIAYYEKELKNQWGEVHTLEDLTDTKQ